MILSTIFSRKYISPLTWDNSYVFHKTNKRISIQVWRHFHRLMKQKLRAPKIEEWSHWLWFLPRHGRFYRFFYIIILSYRQTIYLQFWVDKLLRRSIREKNEYLPYPRELLQHNIFSQSSLNWVPQQQTILPSSLVSNLMFFLKLIKWLINMLSCLAPFFDSIAFFKKFCIE